MGILAGVIDAFLTMPFWEALRFIGFMGKLAAVTVFICWLVTLDGDAIKKNKWWDW